MDRKNFHKDEKIVQLSKTFYDLFFKQIKSRYEDPQTACLAFGDAWFKICKTLRFKKHVLESIAKTIVDHHFDKVIEEIESVEFAEEVKEDEKEDKVEKTEKPKKSRWKK